MRIYYPRYYQRFHCLAANCPDSCCKEWSIDVDATTAEYYRALPGDLGDRLRTVLHETEDGIFMTIDNSRCPMWREDGLCRIHAELGHDALCKTCKTFPRLQHDYGDFMELGLELSCPEAARLILNPKYQERLLEQQSGGNQPDYDAGIMDILLSSREDILSFLDTSVYSLPETLAIILLHSHNIQGQIDGGEPTPFNPENCLRLAHKYAKSKDMNALFDFFRDLEILTARWEALLNHPSANVQWTPPIKELARYLICRYWLQAISDFDLVSRVKFTVVACLTVGTLGNDPIDTAQLFSKEVENNRDNIEAILDGAYTSVAMTDTNILGLLLT